ncbi:MAG: hypothetical protein ACPGJV_06955 [Bacteriovoracaceae bacterium]
MNILFTSFSESFGPIERTLLNELKELEKAGTKPFFWGLEKSFITQACQELEITTHTNDDLKEIKFFNSKVRSELQEFIGKNHIDLVILYGDEKIQTINWVMTRLPETPFIVMCFDSFRKSITKRSLGRIDEFITRSNYLAHELQFRFKVSALKTEVLNTCPLYDGDYSSSGNPEFLERIPLKELQKFQKIGCFIDNQVESVDELMPILDSLVEEFLQERKQKVIFLSSKKWTSRRVHSELRRALMDLGLEDLVLLIDVPLFFSMEDLSKFVDVWLIYNFKSGYNDLFSQALLSGNPSIAERSSYNSEIIEVFQKSALSFKRGDIRGLRDGVSKLKDHHKSLKLSLTKSSPEIEAYFQTKTHGKELLKLITNISTRRKRVIRQLTKTQPN